MAETRKETTVISTKEIKEVGTIPKTITLVQGDHPSDSQRALRAETLSQIYQNLFRSFFQIILGMFVAVSIVYIKFLKDIFQSEINKLIFTIAVLLYVFINLIHFMISWRFLKEAHSLDRQGKNAN